MSKEVSTAGLRIGGAAVFIDSHGVPHDAIITAVHGYLSMNTAAPPMRNPAVLTSLLMLTASC